MKILIFSLWVQVNTECYKIFPKQEAILTLNSKILNVEK